MRSMRCAVLVCLAVAAGAAGEPARFFPAPAPADDPGVEFERLWLHTERQPNVKAVLTSVAAPVGFVHPMPATPEGCGTHLHTSTIASSYGCLFATNGGTFDMSEGGGCMGSVISNGTIWQIDDTSGFASWGMTADGRYVMGDVNSSTVAAEGVTELLSGFIGELLVEDGVPAISTSTLVAQRTAVGIDAAGRLLFLTVDGAEGRDRGMNMTELAEAFVELGAVQAVNLDGGGSTTAWMEGVGLVDRPTCSDYLVPECERNVASIMCVMPGHAAT